MPSTSYVEQKSVKELVKHFESKVKTPKPAIKEMKKIVSLPIERISLNAFRMEEAKMANKYGKNSSLSNLFEKRITNLA